MPRLSLPAGWVGSRPRRRRPPTIAVRRRTYPVNGSIGGLIGLTPRWRPNGSHRTWTVRSARPTARRKAPPGTGISAACAVTPCSSLTGLAASNTVLAPRQCSQRRWPGKCAQAAVLARYAGRELMRFFRADAAFAVPELYKTPEAEGCSCAVRPGKTTVPHDLLPAKAA